MSHNHTNCSIIHRPGNAIYNFHSFLDAYKTAFQRSWNLSIDRKLLAVREKPFPVLRRKKSGWKYNNSSPQLYGFFSEFSFLKTVHFTTMPCEPETALGHKESKISHQCINGIFYARFEDFETFLDVFVYEFC